MLMSLCGVKCQLTSQCVTFYLLNCAFILALEAWVNIVEYFAAGRHSPLILQKDSHM
jgi:hypothetical protein